MTASTAAGAWYACTAVHAQIQVSADHGSRYSVRMPRLATIRTAQPSHAQRIKTPRNRPDALFFPPRCFTRTCSAASRMHTRRSLYGPPSSYCCCTHPSAISRVTRAALQLLHERLASCCRYSCRDGVVINARGSDQSLICRAFCCPDVQGSCRNWCLAVAETVCLADGVSSARDDELRCGTLWCLTARNGHRDVI